MQGFNKRVHHIGFDHAWDGLRFAFVNHPNFKFHLVIAMLVMSLGYYLEISKLEWLFLVFAIVLGLVVEMVNTAIEAVVDLVTEEWRLSAKIAKDVASGAMLVTAVGTAVVGLMVLGPKIF
jgi:diacylglycerol kinase